MNDPTVNVVRGPAWKRAVEMLSLEPLTYEEEQKRLLFAFLIGLSVLMLVAFGGFHLVEGPVIEGAINLAMAAAMLLALADVRRRPDGKWHYRLAVVGWGMLFLYFGTIGEEHGDRVLWAFTYPAMVHFVAGRRWGMILSVSFLLGWMALFLAPREWTGAAAYTPGFIARFVASYVTISCMALFGEHVRSRYTTLLDSRRRRLEEDVHHLAIAERTARELALRDELTGIANRRAILAVLDSERQMAAHTDSIVCVAMADIDHFKQINDEHGHDVGDEVLRECVRRMTGSVRARDRVGRVGGEEFLLVLPETQPGEALAVLERVRKAVMSQPFRLAGCEVRVTVSIGLAALTEASMTPRRALRLADRALYHAKWSGRNQVCQSAATSCVA